jgi:hypothetical protein
VGVHHLQDSTLPLFSTIFARTAGRGQPAGLGGGVGGLATGYTNSPHPPGSRGCSKGSGWDKRGMGAPSFVPAMMKRAKKAPQRDKHLFRRELLVV